MRRKARIIIYVCSAIKENILISKMVEAQTLEGSYVIFETENGIKPQMVLGPFYKKKSNVLEKNTSLRFKFGQNMQGNYNGWLITAMPLLSPPDSAYVLFNKKIDGSRATKPNAMVVKIKDIQDLI